MDVEDQTDFEGFDNQEEQTNILENESKNIPEFIDIFDLSPLDESLTQHTAIQDVNHQNRKFWF